MKKILLFILINTIFFTSLNINVYAANEEDLTHADMIKNYGEDYEKTLFPTVMDIYVRNATKGTENIESVNQFIDDMYNATSNNFNYAKGRLDDLQGESIFGQLTGGGRVMFEVLAGGAITLGDLASDMFTYLFGDSQVNGSNECIFFTTDDNSWSTQLGCNYQIEYFNDLNHRKIYKGVEVYSNYDDAVMFTQLNGGIIRHYIDGSWRSLQQPKTVSALDSFVRSITGGKAKVIRLDGTQQLQYVPSNIGTTINNYINNDDARNDRVNIPILKPQVTCPEGQKVIYPDGKGGFVDAAGVVTDVSNCTITWSKPTIVADDDGTPQIIDEDGNKTEVIEVDKGEACDNIFCFLESIIKEIGKLASNIIDGILEGLEGVFKFLFVPSEDFWNENLNELKSLMFEDEIDEIVTAVEGFKGENSSSRTIASNDIPMGFSSGFKDMAINIMGVEGVIVDADTVNSALDKIHSWVRGFFYALLVIYNLTQIYRLIRGTTMLEGSGVKQTGGKASDN